MAGKRVSLASLAGSKVEAVPGASRPDLIHVHPDTVAPTPLNPRRAFDDTELTELGEDMRGGQLQPCVAVNKAAYLKLYPEHAGQLPDSCRYVMAAGERRWRAARQVGLGTVDLLLRHDLTESRIRFLAAVLSENVQRANFNPIEEADGLRAMLELHDGNQAAAARAMGKSKAWFNQRIGLLRLSDEMVQLVLEGKLTAFRDMRRYASLPAAEQYAAWKADQEQPQAPTPVPVTRAPKTTAAEPEKTPDAYTAVYADRPETAPAPALTPAPTPSPPSGSVDPTPSEEKTTAPTSVRPPATEVIPEPRSTPAEVRSPRPIEWDKPGAVAMLVGAKMPDEDLFFELVEIINRMARDRAPQRLQELARGLVDETADTAH